MGSVQLGQKGVNLGESRPHKEARDGLGWEEGDMESLQLGQKGGNLGKS